MIFSLFYQRAETLQLRQAITGIRSEQHDDKQNDDIQLIKGKHNVADSVVADNGIGCQRRNQAENNLPAGIKRPFFFSGDGRALDNPCGNDNRKISCRRSDIGFKPIAENRHVLDD